MNNINFLKYVLISGNSLTGHIFILKLTFIIMKIREIISSVKELDKSTQGKWLFSYLI